MEGNRRKLVTCGYIERKLAGAHAGKKGHVPHSAIAL